MKRQASAVVFLVAVAGWLWFAGALDVFVGTGLNWWIAGFLLVMSLVLTPFVALHFARWKLVVYGLALVLYLVMALMPWHPRKAFIYKLNSIQVGMTIDEVEQIMDGYMLGYGRGMDRVVPEYPEKEERKTATGNMVYRWSTSSAYNADWGIVNFEDGKVISTEFLPD